MSVYECLAFPGMPCVPLSAMATVGFSGPAKNCEPETRLHAQIAGDSNSQSLEHPAEAAP
jgi:hypothetical protein